jgi:hypothetical protein
MSWGMPILVGSLLAIWLSFVWSRATIIGPIIFAWTGAATGGVVAFVRHFEKAHDQVDIQKIVLFAAVGAACGLLPGFAVRAAYLRGDDIRKAALESLAVGALLAALGLVIGWNINRFSDSPLSSAFMFAAVGAVIGAGAAYVSFRCRGHRTEIEESASPSHREQ